MLVDGVKRSRTCVPYQLPCGPKCFQHAGGMLSVDGFAWRRLVVVVVASIGVEWCRKMETRGTREREEFGAH